MNYPEGKEKGGESFRKWFQFGHLKTALTDAREPEATIDNICYGNYNENDKVVERLKNSNSN